jgi:outer membrane receptor for ferrienterochelin and colicin
LSGKVVSGNETVIGATVVAIHEPSGSRYGSVTNPDGRFHIQGMRVGGPYRVEVSFLGYRKSVFTEITLQLGETYLLDAELTESAEALEEVVVTAYRQTAKTGTATNISARQLTSLPTISRSITDFTKLSPFAGASNSFAGRDGRYNNITVDGASLNNSFGLSTNNLPGGDAQPVSLDAIEEISVNVSPFDVKYSNFTGASINAVTKSGNNLFKGSAYTYIRPKSFTGNKVGDVEVPEARTRSSNLYGLTFSGPILRDKLFFFLNAELSTETQPGIPWRTGSDAQANAGQNISRTTAADMQTMKDFLLTNYGYDPGQYDNFGNFHSDNWKLMARIDWNIHPNHKLTLRLNAVDSNNDVQVNANSAPQPRSSSRFSIDAMSFSNSNYRVRNIVTSATGELNSSFGPKVANKLLATLTHIRDTRDELGSPFPFVDIYKDGKQYMSFGTELFTPHNNVQNDVLSLVDNVNVTLRNHYITVGASFERQYFINQYLRYPYGYYRYASMEDFMNNAAPLTFGLTYGYNGQEAPGAALAFAMGGLYGQDEWSVSDAFRLTYGLRLDLPFYLNDLSGNAAIGELHFDGDRQIDVSVWPSPSVLLSPRLGFRWDVKNDRSVILNGGTGLFTGLLPFVWFTNQPGNSGVIQNTLDPLTQIPEGFSFYPNYRDLIAKYPDAFPSSPAVKAPGSICFVDPDFKMPQVWRSSLGADIQLPLNFMLSVNALYTRDVHNVTQENVNEKAPTDRFAGNDNRSFYPTRDNRINTGVSSAMMLTNGKEKGYQYALNAVLTKKFEYGFLGMLSYTYNVAKDLTANPGSTASSAWSNNVSVNSLNDPGLSYSSFSVPHRLTANLSYEIEYLNHLKTTLGLFYSGSHTGRISYATGNDLNNDGNSSDLLYIPASKDELLFADILTNEVVTYSKEDQAADFWNYIEGNAYLSSRKGKYVERYGDLKPWLNRFDFKVTQNFFARLGSQRYDVQVSLDILNVGNLMNPEWGIYKQNALANNDNIRPLSYAGVTQDKRPIYQVAANNTADFRAKSEWVATVTTSSTWGMLLGMKVLF